MSRRRLPAPLLVLVALVTLAAAGACSADGEEHTGPDRQGDAQPRTEGTAFGEGVFSDIPLHPRTDPVGELDEEDGVTTRSYQTDGTTPREVLDFYERVLADEWQIAGGIEEVGTETVRGEWVRDDERLRITALPAPALERDASGREPIVQYSLSLAPVDG